VAALGIGVQGLNGVSRRIGKALAHKGGVVLLDLANLAHHSPSGVPDRSVARPPKKRD